MEKKLMSSYISTKGVSYSANTNYSSNADKKEYIY